MVLKLTLQFLIFSCLQPKKIRNMRKAKDALLKDPKLLKELSEEKSVRLKTQFFILTGAVTLVPILFGLFLFSFQQAPRDPREPSRIFMAAISDKWLNGDTLNARVLTEEAEKAGMPLRGVAILAPDGTILISSFSHLQEGSQATLKDFTPRSRANPNEPKAELKLLPLDSKNPASPYILFDIQPFWSKQDIRNRNIFLVGSFALSLFILTAILSFFILRSISKAIGTIEADTAIVATGNLDHEVAGMGNHEILMLAKSINLMRLNLKDMLARRSKMLMGVSHDLKTPIALIQGYADALSDDVAQDEVERKQYIEIIQNKAKQLEDLTEELIEFMKIGGDGAVSVEEVSLNELFMTLAQRFEADARLLSRNFSWGFGKQHAPKPDFTVPTLPMNRLLVERAIENLVSNALRYTEAGGSIQFCLTQIEQGTAIVIIDDGPGISPADEPYIFDAFYRSSNSRADGGYGFGLTIVKAVADLHGWTVRVGKRSDGQRGTEAVLSIIEPGKAKS